jgi:hypothetical protein
MVLVVKERQKRSVLMYGDKQARVKGESKVEVVMKMISYAHQKALQIAAYQN